MDASGRETTAHAIDTQLAPLYTTGTALFSYCKSLTMHALLLFQIWVSHRKVIQRRNKVLIVALRGATARTDMHGGADAVGEVVMFQY